MSWTDLPKEVARAHPFKVAVALVVTGIFLLSLVIVTIGSLFD